MAKMRMLTNFNVPNDIRNRFDMVCLLAGRTRTSVLVELMEDFILVQGPEIARKKREAQKLDQTLQESRKIMSFREFMEDPSRKTSPRAQSDFNEDYEPPSGFRSDGQDDW